jgi:hypothetical protein
MNEVMKRQARFHELHAKYNQDNMLKSYHEREDPSYKEIVDMGKGIIPLLLSSLWGGWLPVMALADILGTVPFDIDLETEAGRYDIINEKWYAWGEYNGYI